VIKTKPHTQCRVEKEIESKIHIFLKAHKNTPFAILREAGAVAELRQHLKNIPQLKSKSSAQLSERAEGKQKFSINPRSIEVDRIQLEIKIHASSELQKKAESSKPFGYRTDIVVFKENGVLLTCYGNGPGDVVASTPISSICAAIEVKASPSIDLGQKRAYLEDIEHLLSLVENGICASFFVFLDKSQHMYGSWIKGDPHPARIDWSGYDKSKGLNNQNPSSIVGGGKGFYISDAPPKDKKYVCIIGLSDKNCKGKWCPTNWYAHR